MGNPDDLLCRPADPRAEFTPASLEAWQAAAEASLEDRGLGELEAELVAGMPARLVYAAADLPPSVSAPRRAAPGWHACQRCDHPDPAETGRWIADAAERGMTCTWLAFDAAARHGLDARDPASAALAVDGLVLSSAAELGPVVDAVEAHRSGVRLDGGGNGFVLAAALLAARRLRAGVPAGLAGSLGLDPLGALAGDGILTCGLERSLELLADAAAWTESHARGLRAACVSTMPYHMAGATPVQELACAAATSVEYLRRMTADGVELGTACRHLEFLVPVGRDLPVGIATLRALRVIWARIVEACGGDSAAAVATIHAVTPPRGLARRDPWVNMLRATVGAFSAVAGGADVLTVLPFDAALGHPDRFGRRIAANLHSILREECGLGQVLDPAGGSYAFERLTRDLAAAAWAAFQAIEAAGGMAAVLLGGGLRHELAASAGRQADEIASGRTVITGVSSYPNPAERLLERPATRRAEALAAAVARPPATAHDGRLPELLAAVERIAGEGRRDGSLLDAAIAAMAAGATVGALAAAIRGRGGPTTVPALPAAREEELLEARATAGATRGSEAEAGGG